MDLRKLHSKQSDEPNVSDMLGGWQHSVTGFGIHHSRSTF